MEEPIKKERYFSQKEKKEKERLRSSNQKGTKRTIKGVLFFLILGGVVLAGSFFLMRGSSTPDLGIISKTGIHWHSNLTIKIFNEYQDIPAGIGLEKLPHNPLHTHDRDGVIHLEFPALVKKDDIRLGRFFEIWGKEFNKDCIFDKCSGPEGQLRILVNGKENFEFENYIMQDQDKIEIIFE